MPAPRTNHTDPASGPTDPMSLASADKEQLQPHLTRLLPGTHLRHGHHAEDPGLQTPVSSRKGRVLPATRRGGRLCCRRVSGTTCPGSLPWSLLPAWWQWVAHTPQPSPEHTLHGRYHRQHLDGHPRSPGTGVLRLSASRSICAHSHARL